MTNEDFAYTRLLYILTTKQDLSMDERLTFETAADALANIGKLRETVKELSGYIKQADDETKKYMDIIERYKIALRSAAIEYRELISNAGAGDSHVEKGCERLRCKNYMVNSDMGICVGNLDECIDRKINAWEKEAGLHDE